MHQSRTTSIPSYLAMFIGTQHFWLHFLCTISYSMASSFTNCK